MKIQLLARKSSLMNKSHSHENCGVLFAKVNRIKLYTCWSAKYFEIQACNKSRHGPQMFWVSKYNCIFL